MSDLGRTLREWWGSAGCVRERRVGPTVFYEVGYRRRDGSFCLMGRSHLLERALEKARLRVEAVSPPILTGPGSGSLPRRPRRLVRRGRVRKEKKAGTTGKASTKRPDAPLGIHSGMDARDALRAAEALGGSVEQLHGTGEVVVRLPGQTPVRVQHPTRRKDASRELTQRLLRACRGV